MDSTRSNKRKPIGVEIGLTFVIFLAFLQGIVYCLLFALLHGSHLGGKNSVFLQFEGNSTCVCLRVCVFFTLTCCFVMVAHPCGVCDRAVAKNHMGIQCEICKKWIHIKCNLLNKREYAFYQNPDN